MSLDLSDLTPVEESFTWNGEKYLLKEATGAAEREFTNARTRSAKIDGKGQIKELGDIGSLKPLLIHLCTYYDVPSGNKNHGKRVPQAVIEQWPSKVLSRLYQRAQEISGFDEEDKLGEQLSTALSLPGAPTSLEDLRTYVFSLPRSEYPDLYELFKPSMEEQAGNLQEATTDGSE